MTSTLALRSKDLDVCAKCKTKSCSVGSDKGWACPWGIYMGKLDRNNYCGLCMECVKSCPNDNIGLFLRPAMSDTRIKGYDESWKAFIMLTLAAAYSIVLLGPYGIVKDFANVAEVGDWKGFGIYAGGLWLTALAALPAAFAACVWIGRRLAGRSDLGQKEIFLGLSYVFVPMGLLAWIAFSFPLIMINGSYILNVMSDPMGRGWDLFRTAQIHWSPILPEYVGCIQAPLLFLGAFYAIRAGYRFALEKTGTPAVAVRLAAPVSILVTAITLAFLKLFVG
ncbi:MAG: hypothetical protein A3I06_05125 [Candidatus Lindowbacteria bacterium RIFCSPLOWO2_02_FULL_62_12]|nr:MAG: hypothetical protein A3I06_05125 [Candidatus Lindowbacteria bacterium RIFCSPLOWO2_02_FULL_62_12]